ncbi:MULTISPECIES: AcvB/VirJ family lysyl-phosphatidylglycerol hydrolase [Caballeronia]|uniref:Virulence factor n=1 Tax=Caballeronia zhejiangensis TaxID=871203 RepID=A0A656QKH3_9BURK|nr:MULTISPECIES: AcvB/VirJ family lysyl-phosphatidylglycerol hydrolase [Caballeronia]EKS66659.1 virulence factor family protein [Burkholderia sp. SJ98]KDR30921.1 virulence factor [Caballeronia zhejiangensis]MDR5790063.1 AcvB/VirJ family lysyl-phosphatidylglycerol hydrolase [Caballeronia sp. LP003]MDR5797381.1 AcvB/VirJ family lysyl-phosphatidylglycerol hydrolase [Caballeronia sp. LZ008]
MKFLCKKAAALVVAAVCGVSVTGMAHAAESISGGRYGQVQLTKPAGDMTGFVVLFSEKSGWTPADQQAADALAAKGAMVIGVDTPRYAARLAADKTEKSCHNLVGDAENMSHQLERTVQSNRYFSPILVGSGQGAMVAESALKQAPDNTVAGAVSLAADPMLDPRFNPCAPDATIIHAKGLPGFFEYTAVLEANRSKADALVAMTAPRLKKAGRPTENDVSDLPLIELRAAQPTDLLAIVISGDGGWRDLDKTMALALQRDGVSVIGVDSLRYFWSEKSPQQTADDLARIIRTYNARWHTSHVALVGYSFGADVMPFAYNRLPDAVRAQVSYISLMGFAPDADFQIRVTGWLGMKASDKALKVRPEFDKLPPSMVQCIYGANEEDTLCPALTKTGIEVVKLPGDHHFGGDYDVLARRILAGWRKQIAARQQ